MQPASVVSISDMTPKRFSRHRFLSAAYASPASASIAVFTDGRTMKIDEFKAVEDVDAADAEGRRRR